MVCVAHTGVRVWIFQYNKKMLSKHLLLVASFYFIKALNFAFAESEENEFLLPLLTSVFDLPIDEENRLIEHLLLIIDVPHCVAAYAPERYFSKLDLHLSVL
jgi:hypothetical protein